ncbi:MAG TPA: amylo-alpha-1,6-glucosidase [Terriglobales bacterium]|nr:amylo-alpha-1,6-glucosidase [Terriglobales bacterium]
MQKIRLHLRCKIHCVALVLIMASFVPCAAQSRDLELSRTDRPWEFFSATGTRAGLFGNESGNLEAWVYPLKIFRDFHLHFLTDGPSLPAESLVRTVIVRPESSTIIYTGDTFSVTETLFVPVHESGAVITFEVQTAHPLEIEAVFQRDFQLEWPAALGGTYITWDQNLHAFYLGEEQRKYSALVGSPTADLSSLEYQTNYSQSEENAIRLGATQKGKETKIIAIAASVNGRPEAESTYKRLLSDYVALEKDSAKYYDDYLARTVSVELPDRQLQQAYDWARVSVIQGLVTNPYLGTGLVAGYRTSGTSQRPGFAWFFGRDSFWTAQALDVEGDFAITRTALEFISKFQRADGKIPHEISQGANFVNWFTDYPYAYASADATPLYIIAADDYVTESGDVAFVHEKWDSLWKAYQFLRSTYDSQGLPQNFGFGHGWVEGGPLLPVKTELYQSGLGAQALSALSSLARSAGKDDVSKQLADDFTHQKQLVNQAFWSQDSGTYAFALDKNNQKVIEPSVLATVPMWFGLLDQQKASSMLDQLSSPDHETDWGMRIISDRASRYDAGGYHYGSVWPLFTGWASVGEYRYHHAFSAYSNLRSNSLLALDGSLGHVAEVLSGDYYQPLSTNSPHQIWSAAMVISPLLRGLFGLQTDAAQHKVVLAPHVPADWTTFAIHNVRAGDATLDFAYRKTGEGIELTIESSADASLEFSPAASPRPRMLGAEINGSRVPYQISKSDMDQHVVVRANISKGKNILRIRMKSDFGISYANSLPPLGSSSLGLRLISDSWSMSGDEESLEFAGAAGRRYELVVWNAGQIASVDGAEIRNGELVVSIPENSSETYPHQKVVVRFTAAH